MAEISSSRIVITVLGKNRPGIVAGVTRVLGEANVDIRDITQSIIEDIFTMTMLADTAESKLDFAELQKALGSSRYTSMDKKVGNLKVSQLEPHTYRDYAGYSYRLDGNNVDIETENVTLAANELKYNGLLDCVKQEFQNLQAAMK